jgi:hypothetical protein
MSLSAKHEYNNMITEFCNVKNECVYLNYSHFKYLIFHENADTLISFIISNIDSILLNYDLFTVHTDLKNFTISDIDKYNNFIAKISTLLKNRYPNKLYKCFIHNPPFIFEALFNLVSMFIDKDTQKKITLVKLRKES